MSGEDRAHVEAELGQQRETTTAAAQRIAELLDDGPTFEGAVTQCGGDPAPSVQFTAGGTWSGGTGSQQDRIAEAATALEG